MVPKRPPRPAPSNAAVIAVITWAGRARRTGCSKVVLRRIGEDRARGREGDERDALDDSRGIDDRLLRLRRHRAQPSGPPDGYFIRSSRWSPTRASPPSPSAPGSRAPMLGKTLVRPRRAVHRVRRQSTSSADVDGAVPSGTCPPVRATGDRICRLHVGESVRSEVAGDSCRALRAATWTFPYRVLLGLGVRLLIGEREACCHCRRWTRSVRGVAGAVREPKSMASRHRSSVDSVRASCPGGRLAVDTRRRRLADHLDVRPRESKSSLPK